MGAHCRLLGDLTVTNCPLITDSAFATLNVSQLWRLSITGTRVTGTFAAHVFSKPSILRHFSACKCELLSADFLHSLPALYTGLKKLSLRQMDRLSESDWLQLSTKFMNLQTLYIYNSPEVNDAIAQSFKVCCLELSKVVIKNCSVSEEVLKSFTQPCR